MRMADHPCNGCIYWNRGSGIWAGVKSTCDYLIMTGHARSLICKDQERCTVKKTKEDVRREEQAAQLAAKQAEQEQKKPAIDREKAWALYREGKTDGEIAEELGCSIGWVRKWRGRNLLTQPRGRRPKES